MARYTHPLRDRQTERAQRDLEVWLGTHLPSFAETEPGEGDMFVYDADSDTWINQATVGIRINAFLLMGG